MARGPVTHLPGTASAQLQDDQARDWCCPNGGAILVT